MTQFKMDKKRPINNNNGTQNTLIHSDVAVIKAKGSKYKYLPTGSTQKIHKDKPIKN